VVMFVDIVNSARTVTGVFGVSCHGRSPCNPYLLAVKLLCSQWELLHIVHGVLYRRFSYTDGRPDVLQLLVPFAMRKDFLVKAHVGVNGGHLGIRRTLNHVRRRAFWPGWRGDVRRHCKQCQNCNGRFRGQLPRAGPLQPVLAAGQAAKSDTKLQRSKRAKPMTVHVDKLKPFVADEMPRSWLDDPRRDILDVVAENEFIGGVGPISDEPETNEPETLAKQRLEPVLEDTESLDGQEW